MHTNDFLFVLQPWFSKVRVLAFVENGLHLMGKEDGTRLLNKQKCKHLTEKGKICHVTNMLHRRANTTEIYEGHNIKTWSLMVIYSDATKANKSSMNRKVSSMLMYKKGP